MFAEHRGLDPAPPRAKVSRDLFVEHIEAGIVPLKQLDIADSSCNPGLLEKMSGRLPVMTLSAILITKILIEMMEDGIDPDSWLLLRYRYVSPVKVLIEDGIDPDSWLE